LNVDPLGELIVTTTQSRHSSMNSLRIMTTATCFVALSADESLLKKEERKEDL